MSGGRGGPKDTVKTADKVSVSCCVQSLRRGYLSIDRNGWMGGNGIILCSVGKVRVCARMMEGVGWKESASVCKRFSNVDGCGVIMCEGFAQTESGRQTFISSQCGVSAAHPGERSALNCMNCCVLVVFFGWPAVLAYDPGPTPFNQSGLFREVALGFESSAEDTDPELEGQSLGPPKSWILLMLDMLARLQTEYCRRSPSYLDSRAIVVHPAHSSNGPVYILYLDLKPPSGPSHHCFDRLRFTSGSLSLTSLPPDTLLLGKQTFSFVHPAGLLI
ncbi:hypothetical protein F5I97DRAFT_1827639 [Phlebopus sp. FC_14]|nr:hypothetical protein F5I97DRAFT_1827639 [Phlebopus sp. FC_14]